MVLQHDIMADARTRVIAPLYPSGPAALRAGKLNPPLPIDAIPHAIAVHLLATATEAELGTWVANLAHHRDDIIHALDLLFTGV